MKHKKEKEPNIIIELIFTMLKGLFWFVFGTLVFLGLVLVLYQLGAR